MLSTRRLSAGLSEQTRKSIVVTKGCPQGSVISPLLWILVIDGLLARHGLYTQCYADDLTVLVRGKFISTLCEKQQSALKIVEDWCKQSGLSVNPEKIKLILFTSKRPRDGLFNPTLTGKEVKFVSEAKHLGVTIDEKLTWQPHVELKIQKAINSFWAVKAAIGRTWGLSPKVLLWLYKAVIMPSFSYGSVIWWKASQQRTIKQKLDKLQRLACVAITGAFRTTPTRAMEALIDLPPLHISIQAEAMRAAHRLYQGELWGPSEEGHATIWSQMEQTPIFLMRSDRMVIQYDLDKSFKTQIPAREAWEDPQSRAELLQGQVWYTDGSLMEGVSGAGVFCESSGKKRTFPLGMFASIFQSEIFAILQAADLSSEEAVQGQKITICSDSQAAIKALASHTTKSHLVWECKKALNTLARQTEVEIIWVPGHNGVEGNETADELAREGANCTFTGSEPCIGCAPDLPKREIKSWSITNARRVWSTLTHCEHARQLAEGYSSSKAHNLLNMSKTKIRIITGVLTGHFLFNKHLKRIGIRDDPDCSFCGEEEDTGIHFMCRCPFFQRERMRIFDSMVIESNAVKLTNPNKLWDFISASKRFGDYIRMTG